MVSASRVCCGDFAATKRIGHESREVKFEGGKNPNSQFNLLADEFDPSPGDAAYRHFGARCSA